MTTMKGRQSMLFSKAIDVFFRHTLCEIQVLRSKNAKTPCMNGNTRSGGFNQSCEELLRCMENILGEETHGSKTFDCVYYELAMVDRWNQSIIFSQMSDKCHDPRDRFVSYVEKNSGSWKCRLAFAQQSPYLLANAMEATNEHDSTLAADWVAASVLSDAAARQCALFRSTDIDFPDRRYFGSLYAGHEEACKMIIQLVENFPEIVMGEVEPVIALYKFKKDVAVGIDAAERHAYDPNLRIAALGPSYAVFSGVAATFAKVLREIYARPFEQLHQQEICRAKVTALNTFLNQCRKTLFALDSCGECTQDLQCPMRDLLNGVKMAVVEVAAVASQLGPLDQPAPPAVDSQKSAVSGRLAELHIQAQELKSKAALTQKAACPRRTLAQMYDSKAIAARSVSPQSLYHAQLATPLQRLEADLQLCTADCYLLVDVERKGKLLLATQGLNGLVHALQRPAAVAALSGLRPLRDTPSVREVLQKLVCHIYTLTDILAGELAGNMSAVKAWQSSLHAVARAVSALKRADADPAEHALAAHSVDLNVLLLHQCVHGPSPYVALVQQASVNFEGVVCMNDGSDPLYPTLTPEQRERLRCFRLYLALRYEQEVLVPLATTVGVFANFLVLNFPSLKVDLIADVAYAEWVSKVIVASNNAVSCERQAELVGTENAGDLLKAAGHYARAAACLTQKAENAIVGAVDTPGNSSRVTAVTVSARLALMSAKACEKAHNAVLAGNPEACALYRKAVEILPTPSDGAQLFFAPKRNKNRVGVREKVALYYTHAGDALVRRKRDEAAMWQEAAQICETALSPMLGGKDKLLREEMRADWQSCVQRAEEVVQKATSLRG